MITNPGEGGVVSKLDDLQTSAHQVSGDMDSPLSGLGQVIADNEDAVQEAVQWGNEGGAQVLDGPGKQALEEALQYGQQMQEKLKEYADVVEQAKRGSG